MDPDRLGRVVICIPINRRGVSQSSWSTQAYCFIVVGYLYQWVFMLYLVEVAALKCCLETVDCCTSHSSDETGS